MSTHFRFNYYTIKNMVTVIDNEQFTFERIQFSLVDCVVLTKMTKQELQKVLNSVNKKMATTLRAAV